MSLIPIVGLIEFPFSFICSKEVLGESIKISIGEISAKITFPSYPNLEDDKIDRLSRPLDPPNQYKDWRRGDESLKWGSIVVLPRGSSIVERVAIEFMVPSEQEGAVCKIVYTEFEKWLELFEQYVRLLTTQTTRHNYNTYNGYENALLLFSNSESSPRYIPTTRTTNLKGSWPDEKKDLTLERLKECCRLASLGRLPVFEYKLLLEAYDARSNNDYRKAIIEAATALEVCLTNKILIELSANNNINSSEKLLKKNRTLGGRFTLCKKIGIQLPSNNYKKMILDPRNEVIHEPKLPTNRQNANEVISEVEKYLQAFSPILHEDT